jgi:hypothetical protein
MSRHPAATHTAGPLETSLDHRQRGKSGSDPRITWLESPVVVDNVTDTIVSD